LVTKLIDFLEIAPFISTFSTVNPLGYTKEGYPVFHGEQVWEPQQVRQRGVVHRKKKRNEKGEEEIVDTFIPGKLIWQPVEVLVSDSLPSLCYRRHYECFTYCESLNKQNGNLAHAKMQQDQ
jgi:hypothetical protein